MVKVELGCGEDRSKLWWNDINVYMIFLDFYKMYIICLICICAKIIFVLLWLVRT